MTKTIDISSLIPVGYENAISRMNLCIKARMTDRKVRKNIEMSDVLIINLGTGYFIPLDEEESLVKRYKYQEMARRQGINRKLQKVDSWLNVRKHNDDSFTDQIGLEEFMEI